MATDEEYIRVLQDASNKKSIEISILRTQLDELKQAIKAIVKHI